MEIERNLGMLQDAAIGPPRGQVVVAQGDIGRHVIQVDIDPGVLHLFGQAFRAQGCDRRAQVVGDQGRLQEVAQRGRDGRYGEMVTHVCPRFRCCR